MEWLKHHALIIQIRWLNWRVKRLLLEPGRLFKTLITVPIALCLSLLFLIAAIFVLSMPIWVLVKPDLIDLSGKNKAEEPTT